MKRLLLAITVAALAACTTTSPDVVSRNDAQRMSTLVDGTVLSLRPVVVEGVCGHRKHRWMGTFDLIADMAGQRWLLDLKTTRSGIFGETALQLAAYRHAEFYLDADGNEVPMPDVERVGAVWCRADGYDVIPVVADGGTYRMFQYAQMVARFTTGLGREWVGEALRPEVAA